MGIKSEVINLRSEHQYLDTTPNSLVKSKSVIKYSLQIYWGSTNCPSRNIKNIADDWWYCILSSILQQKIAPFKRTKVLCGSDRSETSTSYTHHIKFHEGHLNCELYHSHFHPSFNPKNFRSAKWSLIKILHQVVDLNFPMPSVPI